MRRRLCSARPGPFCKWRRSRPGGPARSRISRIGPIGEGFQGRYFKAGGRHICIDRASKGKEIATDYPIAETFKLTFEQSAAPAVSGIGIGIDTEHAKGNGVAKSFISEIEFLQ